MPNQAILLVDDEAQILKSLRRLLRKEPYDIYTADGGENGLKVLREQSIQMIISDQRMPQMSGTEFLQKAREICPNTIRVMLSGYAEPEAILSSINQGEVFRFVAKPWNDDELKTTIRQCLEHYDIVAENQVLTEQSLLHTKQLEEMNNMLLSSVEQRTRSLQFSQEVLENLPTTVLGISLEEEIVLTNKTARHSFEGLRNLIPGTNMTEVFPENIVTAIRDCIAMANCDGFEFKWENKSCYARPSKLGSNEEPRGLVLLVEESEQ